MRKEITLKTYADLAKTVKQVYEKTSIVLSIA